MPVSLHPLPLTEPALTAVARWLLDQPCARSAEDLAGAVVLLPSSRACGQLGHALLEVAGTEALLLPRILTPSRLADHLVELLGLADSTLPAAALRPLILAPRLARLPWLADRPEAAPGLAAELVTLFDEVRLACRDALILDGCDDALLQRAAGAGADEVLATDLSRIREAWAIYRDLVPRDEVDLRVQALLMAATSWPGEKPTLVAAAHLARLDTVAVGLLRGLDDQSVPSHWLTMDADDPRSRLLLAGYRDPTPWSHPLAGVRLLAEKVSEQVPPAPRFDGADVVTRLGELGTARDEIGPRRPLQLVPCRDPEHESRVVAAAVCEALAVAGSVPEIVVATPDRDLAARIAAQLRDAGVDVDDSRGRPLAGLPAGRLLRDMLRIVVAGWPFGPLFEALTHPYVRLAGKSERPGHAVQVQILEAAVRRSGTARRGLGALRTVAEQDDLAAGERRRGWSLAGFVDGIAAAFAPLQDVAARPVAWSAVTAALQDVWLAVACDRPLDGDPDPRRDHDDLGAVAGLLAALEQAAPWLDDAPLAVIAAGIDSLLADPSLEVRPHRQRHLPVRLVGLVEARLERVDRLFLAGLAQDVFPGRLPRPLLLSDPVRRALDLAHWRVRAGRDAELFLRLLHGAPEVTVTWPAERDGQPSLPSPLVQRLAMVASDEPVPALEPLLYRRDVPDPEVIADLEIAFRAEPEPVPAAAVPIPSKLSHSSLQRFRDCPYRFLLADALRLKRPDPLDARFTAADHGNLAHAIMQSWLDPGGQGTLALAAGDADAARIAFETAATEIAASSGRDLPGNAVALRSLLALAPSLVAWEIERHRTWLPVALEAPFTVTLGEAADWLAAAGEKPPPVPDQWRSVVLRGYIDRVDRRRDDPGVGAVIDYKTGERPARKRVTGLRELQVHLYGLAVSAGTVKDMDAPLVVAHGGYYGLRRDDIGLPGTPHLDGADELAAGARAILETAVSVLDPAVPFALVPDWREEGTAGKLPCQTCDFRGICRLEERDATPALAARVAMLLTATRGGAA